MSMLVQLTDDSTAARVLDLLARHCPRLMRQGGGALREEKLMSGVSVSDEEARGYLELAQQGLTQYQIARRVGRSQICISKHLRRLGWVAPVKFKAERHRQDIERMTREGKNGAFIARELDMAQSRVNAIRRAMKAREKAEAAAHLEMNQAA